MRHMPTGRMRGCQQNRGMYVPPRSAAAMIISPGLASMTFPSTVIFMGSAKRAPAVLDVDEELVAEHLDAGDDGGGDGGPEDADGGLLGRPAQAGGDVVAE